MLPTQPSFISLSRRKLKSAKSRLKDEHDRTTQPKLTMFSMVLTLEPGVIVMQKKGHLLWPDSEVQGFSLVSIDMKLFRFQEIQKDHPFPIPKDSPHHFPAEGCILNFIFGVKFACHHSTTILTLSYSGDIVSCHW